MRQTTHHPVPRLRVSGAVPPSLPLDAHSNSFTFYLYYYGIVTTCRVYVILFQGTSGPRPAYAGNGGQGKSGPRGPPVGSNITPQQTNIGGNSIYRGGTWGGGANPYPSLRYATPMGPTNATSYSAGYTHQPSVSS